MNYANTPMSGISESDYETLLTHLTEQLAAAFVAQRGAVDLVEAAGWASDALTNSWQPEMTANNWLAVAGDRLGVDTGDCVGA